MNWYTFSLLILASIIGLLLLIVAAQTKLAEDKDEYIQALESDNTRLRRANGVMRQRNSELIEDLELGSKLMTAASAELRVRGVAGGSTQASLDSLPEPLRRAYRPKKQPTGEETQ